VLAASVALVRQRQRRRRRCDAALRAVMDRRGVRSAAVRLALHRAKQVMEGRTGGARHHRRGRIDLPLHRLLLHRSERRWQPLGQRSLAGPLLSCHALVVLTPRSRPLVIDVAHWPYS